MKILAIGTITAALVACTAHDVTVGNLQEVASMKAIPNRDLDVLFVVDNSPSMADKQMSLARNFPLMIDALMTLDDGLPNLHIGVVTSDMGTSGSSGPPGPGIGTGQGACQGVGDDGALVQGMLVTDRFISDVASGGGSRTVNYTGALRDAFAQLASVGENGCGFEQHLRSMQRALDGQPSNAGFLRPEANLAVVILADEDDCSIADPTVLGADTTTFGPLQSFRCTRFGVQCSPDDMMTPGDKSDCAPRAPAQYIDDVTPFADFLKNLKGDERKVMVAGAVGVPTPFAIELRAPPGGGAPIPALAHSCTTTDPLGNIEVADPAVRIASFLGQFPERSTLASICDPDLTLALGQIGESTKKLVGDPCLDTSLLADSSPDPGIQPACEVVDVRDSAPNEPIAIPACGTSTTDCFELVADAAACPATVDHVRLRVHRSAAAADDTWTHVRCQLANP